MRCSGSEAIVHCLEQVGTEYVFGLCGHANISVLDALAVRADVKAELEDITPRGLHPIGSLMTARLMPWRAG